MEAVFNFPFYLTAILNLLGVIILGAFLRHYISVDLSEVVQFQNALAFKKFDLYQELYFKLDVDIANLKSDCFKDAYLAELNRKEIKRIIKEIQDLK